MFEFLLIVLILALSLVILFQKNKKCAQNLPKGPQGLPLFGNMLQLTRNFPHNLSHWAKQYGKIYTIYLGSKPVLVVNDVKLMKEIFGSMESTGRYQHDLMSLLYEGNWGIVNAEGETWLEQNHFCMSTMKTLGFASGSFLDPIILDEANDLCLWIDEKVKNGPNDNIHFNKILLQLTSNTIWNIVTGERIKSKDSKMVQVLINWVNALNVATKRGLTFLPILKYIAPEKCGYNGYIKAVRDLHKLCQTYFDKHKQAREMSKELKNSPPTNMISAYLQKVESCDDETSSFYGEIGMKNSFHSVTSLLLGGSETTASALNWLIFYLAVNSNVQKKVHEEIDQVIGRDRDPALTDRQRMPYMDAVILETLRYCSLIPLGIIHQLLGHVQYESFKLPKGMLLFANLYHANHNPEIWGDAETFRPERFLDGSEIERKLLRESVATFQEGKRRCPGEQMGKDTMFLFAAKLFQKYEFYPDKNICAEKYMKPTMGWILCAPDIGVHVKPRLL